MNSACPTCATVYGVRSGYGGLITCKCGVRFDAFSHIHKEKPRIGRQMVLATTVQCTDIPLSNDEAIEETDFIKSFSNFSSNLFKLKDVMFARIKATYKRRRLVIIPAAVVLGFVVISLSFSGVYSENKSTLSHAPITVANPPVVKKSTPGLPPAINDAKDASNIIFSDVIFNAVGRDTYFIQAYLKNTSKMAVSWPVIEVTLLAGGLEVGQKLMTPLEYLASDVSIGTVRSLEIAPDEAVKVRMNINYQNDTSKTEDYRIRPVYLDE